MFPCCDIDLRESYSTHWKIDRFAELCESARISDTHLPFEKQPEILEPGVPMHDGFVLRRLLLPSISQEESGLEHLHIVLTPLLTCTFDEVDSRYHARTVVCGTPSLVSCSGIVEAPAKPKEYYYLALSGIMDSHALKKEFAGKFIDYEDERLTHVALGYTIQAIFFFVTDGEPFCSHQDCRLYNAHWQADVIRTLVEKPIFCSRHSAMLNKFNRAKKSR